MGSQIAHDGAFSFSKRDYLMYKNRHPEANYKAVILEYVKGIGAILGIMAVLMLAEMAFSTPTCALNYHSGTEVCQ